MIYYLFLVLTQVSGVRYTYITQNHRGNHRTVVAHAYVALERLVLSSELFGASMQLRFTVGGDGCVVNRVCGYSDLGGYGRGHKLVHGLIANLGEHFGRFGVIRTYVAL